MIGIYVATLPLALLGASESGGTADAPVVFSRAFDEARPLDGAVVGRGARVAPGGGRAGTPALVVERPGDAGAGSSNVTWALPAEKLRGRRVRVEAYVKADDVVRPPHSWNGVKVMLHLKAAGEEWPQAPVEVGSFGWSRVSFTRNVPNDLHTAELVLGLEETTGRATFDGVRIEILPTRRASPAAGAKPDARHGPGRLRGVMIGTQVDADDLRDLARTWGANHVRWQLLWGGFPKGPADSASEADYDRWIDGEIARLVRLLPVCKAEGIAVLIDLHTPPGGRAPGSDNMSLFRDPARQRHFLKVWERIVKRFRDDPAVWGYDLLNEPVVGMLPDSVMTWPELALECARRIRAIDPKKAIVVEPAPWGDPDGLDDFEPLPGIEGVVYSVHMYKPHAFTHQGVYDKPTGPTYPGAIEGRNWGKEQVREALGPARRFERDYNVPIYIGEFGAIRWAPGSSARDYLRDVIDVMEEYGWDWAYHAFREWHGWSFEHGPDPKDDKPSPEPTDRGLLLKSYFARNKADASK